MHLLPSPVILHFIFFRFHEKKEFYFLSPSKRFATTTSGVDRFRTRWNGLSFFKGRLITPLTYLTYKDRFQCGDQ